MRQATQTYLDDASCPTAFVVLPSIIGALVWLCVMLSHMPR
ncbi:MAG: hypothetical protein NZO58_05390 [Gemmataceae bacterium]|nr:hypothetical protein [Gemmataceae bacterium]